MTSCRSLLSVALVVAVLLSLSGHVDGFSSKSRLPFRIVSNQPKGTTLGYPPISTSPADDESQNMKNSCLSASTSSTLFGRPTSTKSATTKSLSKAQALLTKMGMILFILSMCLALPVALLPQALLHRLGLISRVKQNQLALSSGQFCARWLLRLIPFCNVKARSVLFDDNGHRQMAQSGGSNNGGSSSGEPQPSVWVCNHTSALDVFILLAKDKELRGKGKRPIKIVYVSTTDTMDRDASF